ncbi:DUF1571 domain-containing protein [Tautonia rosea]|uniref:DUF1571 domain-containing protein n=1 Tax=Tautonia rosea TaxID=2728037 RepID=UPI001475B788|nr:DUF1571 domain-containing protein [Tautonia rosea]
MVANRASACLQARRWWVAIPSLMVPMGLVAGFCWWLTPSLESLKSDVAQEHRASRSNDLVQVGVANADETSEQLDLLPDWPEHRLEGQEAKQYLLDFMEYAVQKLDQVDGYSANLVRQERIKGELGLEQSLQIKVQHEPFAVYLRFEAPRPGKEALYHSGRFDDHLLAHNGDWTRRLFPRLKVDPHGPIALAENRHPITEAGLAHLARKLLHFRKLDLDDPRAETILDREIDENGKLWYCSTHSHSSFTEDRPFAYVEIRYCPELLIPLHIVSYDWPQPGCDDGELQLAERYHYENVNFDITFSELDFDPTNPDYGFQRY